MYRMAKIARDPSYYEPKNLRETRLVFKMRSIAAKHGLDISKWEFGFFGGTKALGLCREYYCVRQQRMRYYVLISRTLLAKHRDDAAVLNEVICHEIAHALGAQDTGRIAHCKTWAAWCKVLGVPARLSIPGIELETTCPKAKRREARGGKWAVMYGDEVIKTYARKTVQLEARVPRLALKGVPGSQGKLRLVQLR